MHLEKYPILYFNKEVVYFKMGRQEEIIHHIPTYKIRTDNNIDYYCSTYYDSPCYNEYYIPVGDINLDQIFENLTKKQKAFRKNDKFLKIEQKYLNAKAYYEKMLAEYEEAKKYHEANDQG